MVISLTPLHPKSEQRCPGEGHLRQADSETHKALGQESPADHGVDAGVHITEVAAHPATAHPAPRAGRRAPSTTPRFQAEYQEPLCLAGNHLKKLVSLGETCHLRGDLQPDEGS